MVALLYADCGFFASAVPVNGSQLKTALGSPASVGRRPGIHDPTKAIKTGLTLKDTKRENLWL